MTTIRRHISAFPFYAPALGLVGFFIVYPVVSSFYFSLTDWNGIAREIRFIGLANFRELLGDKIFAAAVRNTFAFAFGVTCLQSCLALALALAVDVPFFGRGFVRVAFFVPSLLSALVAGYSWNFILNPLFGSLNAVLRACGLDGLAADWLGNPRLALPSVMGVNIWQYAGNAMVIYLAAIQGVPRELYEASDIDGAGRLRKFAVVTFPLIAPAFTVNVVLALIGSMKTFDLIFVMTNGGPGYATETIATLLYNQAFQTNRMGYGTAIATVLFLIILVFSFILIRLLRKREEFL